MNTVNSSAAPTNQATPVAVMCNTPPAYRREADHDDRLECRQDERDEHLPEHQVGARTGAASSSRCAAVPVDEHAQPREHAAQRDHQAARAHPDERRVVDARVKPARGLLQRVGEDQGQHRRSDRGTDLSPGGVAITGADDVAQVVLARGTPFAPFARPAVVDGQAGAAVVIGGRLRSVVKFSIDGDRVVGMDLTIDPDTLSRVSW